MQNTVLEFVIFPFFTALLIVLLITPIIIKYVTRFGLMDDSNRSNHPGIIHTKPVPRGGGIALFLGAFLAAMFFLPMNPVMLAIFLASFLAFLLRR